MKELLKKVSTLALQLNDIDFSEPIKQSQWLGQEVATNEAIEALEKRLKLKLPNDYKTFLKTTNGFLATTYTEPTFLNTENVDYLKNIDAELIAIWRETGNEEVANDLERSICIAGVEEEQQFLIIPPKTENDKWQYWKFAHWIPGEETYVSLKDYFESVILFLEEIDE